MKKYIVMLLVGILLILAFVDTLVFFDAYPIAFSTIIEGNIIILCTMFSIMILCLIGAGIAYLIEKHDNK